MKSPIKILLITFAFLQLLFATYLSIGAIPMKIENEYTGDMYSFEEISFNLSSTEYEKSPDPITILSGEPERITTTFSNSKGEEKILVSQTSNANYIKVFNKSLRDLQNPFKNRFVVRNIKRDIKSGTPAIGLKGLAITDIVVQVHKGENKTFILNKTTFSDNSMHYSAEGKIENNYYHISLLEDADPENIYEFMRSVTIL
jgi:hypothetical protein